MNNKFNIDFIGRKKLFFIISIVMIAVSILSTFVFGANLDIQFKGGTILTYIYDGEIDQAQFESDATAALGGIGVTSTVGEDFSTGRNTIQLSLISNSGLTSDKQFELTNTLTEKYAANGIELIESSDVSPSSGKEFFLKCLVAVLLSFIVLIIYIAIRFKNIGGWLAGVCAITGSLHILKVVVERQVIAEEVVKVGVKTTSSNLGRILQFECSCSSVTRIGKQGFTIFGAFSIQTVKVGPRKQDFASDFKFFGPS